MIRLLSKYNLQRKQMNRGTTVGLRSGASFSFFKQKPEKIYGFSAALRINPEIFNLIDN